MRIPQAASFREEDALRLFDVALHIRPTCSSSDWLFRLVDSVRAYFAANLGSSTGSVIGAPTASVPAMVLS